MREILFRGKRCDNGEWVVGNLFVPDIADTPTQICIGTNIIRITYNVNPETVGQFTGLTDKNGKKIFEGDIVRAYWANGELAAVDVVVWSDVFIGFHAGESCSMYGEYLASYEIVGNIHDNPELLNKEVETDV